MPAMYLKTSFTYKITVRDFPERKLTNQQILDRYNKTTQPDYMQSEFFTDLTLNYLDAEKEYFKDAYNHISFDFTSKDLIAGEIAYSLVANSIVVKVDGVIKYSVRKGFEQLFLDVNSKWSFGGVSGEPWRSAIGELENEPTFDVELIDGGELFVNKYYNPNYKSEEKQEFTLVKVTTSSKKLKL
jgi:hypothetical protein